MPPRAAQKRKADDGPYALSGLKRAPASNGGSNNNQALYPTREHRDRDGYGTHEPEWYDKYGRINAYEKDMVSHTTMNTSNKRRKADPSSGAGAAYYQVGMGGNGMIRGEEGPIITVCPYHLCPCSLLLPACRSIWPHSQPLRCSNIFKHIIFYPIYIHLHSQHNAPNPHRWPSQSHQTRPPHPIVIKLGKRCTCKPLPSNPSRTHSPTV